LNVTKLPNEAKKELNNLNVSSINSISTVERKVGKLKDLLVDLNSTIDYLNRVDWKVETLTEKLGKNEKTTIYLTHNQQVNIKGYIAADNSSKWDIGMDLAGTSKLKVNGNTKAKVDGEDKNSGNNKKSLNKKFNLSQGNHKFKVEDSDSEGSADVKITFQIAYKVINGDKKTDYGVANTNFSDYVQAKNFDKTSTIQLNDIKSNVTKKLDELAGRKKEIRTANRKAEQQQEKEPYKDDTTSSLSTQSLSTSQTASSTEDFDIMQIAKEKRLQLQRV